MASVPADYTDYRLEETLSNSKLEHFLIKTNKVIKSTNISKICVYFILVAVNK